MLSRIAESLYWLGRYIERAEDTARILDVHVHHLLEGPLVDEDLAARNLLLAMGADPELTPPLGRASFDARSVTELLAYDESTPSSITASLSAARTNARGVSEAISWEMWEALNATYNALPAQVAMARSVGPYTFFRYVRERTAILAGLADSTMSHDDAWRFLVIGRNLERIDMLARLISTGMQPAEGEDVDWVVLLRSCSAHEAFLRTYRREVDAPTAAEFLLLDRLFPRSVFCAVSIAESCLVDLDPHPARAGLSDEARRLIGRVRTNLEFRRIEDLLTDLPEQLSAVQAGCSAASAALAARYFRRAVPVEWSGSAMAPALSGELSDEGGTR